MKFFPRFFDSTEIEAWDKPFSSIDTGQRVKIYPRLPRHRLPEPDLQFHRSLNNVLLERTSAQEFRPEPFSLSLLSSFLASVGTRPNSPFQGDTRRTYPSAGARYPGETYLITLNCEAIAPGLYHYALEDHELEELWIRDLGEELREATNDSRVVSASAIIVFSLVYGRIFEKYGKRGLRYGLMELGHMAQNISLTAAALQKGCCEIGGFVDKTVNGWLDIDGDSESAALLVALGGQELR